MKIKPFFSVRSKKMKKTPQAKAFKSLMNLNDSVSSVDDAV